MNRLGLGVDRIYEESISLGKDLPRYEADESHVRLVLPTKTHGDFARFVRDIRGEGRKLNLDELIVLRALTRRPFLDRWSASGLLQLSEQQSAATLVSLRERGFLAPQGRGRGTKYGLARRYSALTESAVGGGYIELDEEYVRLRLLALLAERGPNRQRRDTWIVGLLEIPGSQADACVARGGSGRGGRTWAQGPLCVVAAGACQAVGEGVSECG